MSTPLRASERAYQTLRDDIVGWKLSPGVVLGEVEQSTRLGVSRTPLREALSRLMADGLVASQTGRGLVVTDISVENIRELFAVREALEVKAVRLAAERHSGTIFADLEREFEAVPGLLSLDSNDRSAYFDLVRRFDAAVDEAGENIYLTGALSSLRTHLARVRRLAQSNPQRLADAAREHLLIVRAIVMRDAELAAHATHVHLHHALTSALAMAANSPLRAAN
ncbi:MULTISPECIES: GntR family transcriptional regulator [unclassified Salinibacterium]|uniref:GntR family transcriptional regulator n=1 Tax=unclassified Salinibacterium TaxID=2632331 RepID=UPI0018CDE34C|nr:MULTISPECIES: GntR family transcriptional regulator [unclassified Salinibacterium]MBH0024767.1 GntR family transcriptional regulator [Salinibacterium sp. SWN248]MBH0054772.1 GntR family transcriptional regulator [Salinibacterium sp. SWN139]MBH0084083.1 GntR family transcriptional regulator [Salinibacterium sp. SWN167]